MVDRKLAQCLGATVTSWLLFVPMLTNAGMQIYEPERVTSIAAVSNSKDDPSQPFRSGLFVAYTEEIGGRIAYFQDKSETNVSGDLAETSVSFYFENPTAIAELDGQLVVWNDARGDLSLTDLVTGNRTMLAEGVPDVSPSQIAISPEGLILLLDDAGRRVYWTTTAGGELRLLKSKIESTSITFLSWNKLAVLNRDEQQIEVISLYFDGDFVQVRDRHSLTRQEIQRSRANQFRSIAAQDGVLYVADSERIYSYIEASDELVLAVGDTANLTDISQLQVSSDSFFVIDKGEFRKIDRTVPIEVVLDSEPEDAQLALLDLYVALHEKNLLPYRSALAVTDYATVEHFLVSERVLILPSDEFLEANRRVGIWPFRRDQKVDIAGGSNTYLQFANLYCDLNPDRCAGLSSTAILKQPVRSGQSVVIPNLVLNSELGVKDVSLDGMSVIEHLDRIIVSDALRKKVSVRLLQRLNKSLAAVDSKSLSTMRKGSVTLPYETWSVTAALPITNHGEDYGQWEGLKKYDGVEFNSQKIYTEQSAYSHHLDIPAGITASQTCNALRDDHEKWAKRINYPFDYLDFVESTVKVGIAEQDVIKSHQIFELNSAFPTWFEFDPDPDEFDLVPTPSPASFSGGVQEVDGVDVYTQSLHHGTHVSAIVGGRHGHCWAGLLPRSQLLFIEASGESAINAGLFDAKRGFVKTINVSQRLADSLRYRKFIENEYKSRMFVLAAGNSNVNLNEDDDDSAVKWSDRDNVIVVTALNAGDQIMAGVNYGKKLVDLAAPGLDIVSASDDKKYGRASGTSQAAPAVSAAAAYLLDEDYGEGKPLGSVKARLIATADWHENFDGKVWGGALNLGDAVRFPDSDVIRTNGDDEDLHVITGRTNTKLKIEDFPATLYTKSDGSVAYQRRKIPMNIVLSLKRNKSGGTYRVVMRNQETEKLMIILHAKLSGTIKCESAMLWSTATASSSASELCDAPINIETIRHYYKAMSYSVEW